MNQTAAGPRDIVSPLTAGFVTAIVGFSSSFILVMEGLRHVGATPAQALSGLIAVTLAFSAGMVILSVKTKTPMTMAWSTPGSALLLTTAAPGGGFREAVGGFIVCAVLVMLTGLIRPFERFVTGLPVSLTQALVAGILIPICIAPFTGLAESPLAVGLLLAVYGLFLLVAPRWAVPAVLIVCLSEAAFGVVGSGKEIAWVPPALEFVPPQFGLSSALSIGLGMFIVTMAAQNLPGMGVLKAHGIAGPWRLSMLVCGGTSAVGALFGSHATNLSALSAAIALGDMSGQDRRTKWWATPAAASVYVLLAVTAGSLVALIASAPAGVIGALAGLALLPTFATTASHAFADRQNAAANGVVVLIAASGVALGGFSGAVVAFVVGLVLHRIIAIRGSARRRS